MRQGLKIVIIGPRASGKTVLLKRLESNLKGCPGVRNIQIGTADKQEESITFEFDVEQHLKIVRFDDGPIS